MKKYYWNNDDLSNCLSKLRNALYIETEIKSDVVKLSRERKKPGFEF